MSSENILGRRVFELRKSAGMTQKQLGESVGLSMQAINDIEKGRRETTISKVILLAQILKTTLDYLVGETDDPKRYDKPTKMESFFRQMQICLISMLKNAKWQESTKLSYHFIFESTIIQC